MLLRTSLILSIVCAFSFYLVAQTEIPFRLQRIDQTTGQKGVEKFDSAPFRAGHLIFNNNDATGHLYYFDGTENQEIELPPNRGVHDLGGVAEGRFIVVDLLTAVKGALYFLPETGGEPVLQQRSAWSSFNATYPLPGTDRLIAFNVFDANADQMVGLSAAREEPEVLPVDGPVTNKFYLSYYNDQLLVNTETSLYLTDGTAAGTRQIHEGEVNILLRTAVAGDRLYFSDGTDLYYLDSPTSPIIKVTDANFPGNLRPVEIGEIAATAGGLLYTASTPTTGTELFLTDGTSAGSSLFREFLPGPESGVRLNSVTSRTSAVPTAGTYYFRAGETSEMTQLWESDGTTEGTVLIKDFTQSVTSNWAIYNLDVAPGDRLFSVRTIADGELNYRLYGKKAGTNTTKLLVESPRSIKTIGEKEGNEWILARTTDEEVRPSLFAIRDLGEEIIQVAAGNSPNWNNGNTIGLYADGKYYLSAISPETSREPASYTVGADTVMILADINPGGATSYPYSLPIREQEGAFFLSYRTTTGFNVFQTDGTPAGTSLLFDLHGRPGSSKMYGLRNGGGEVIVNHLTSTTDENGRVTSYQAGYLNDENNEILPIREWGEMYGESVGDAFMINSSGLHVTSKNEQFRPNGHYIANVSPPVQFGDRFLLVSSNRNVNASNSHLWSLAAVDTITGLTESLYEQDQVAFWQVVDGSPFNATNRALVSLAGNGGAAIFGFPSNSGGMGIFRIDSDNTVERIRNIGLGYPLTAVSDYAGDLAAIRITDQDLGDYLQTYSFATEQLMDFRDLELEEEVLAIRTIDNFGLVMTTHRLSGTINLTDLSEDPAKILIDETAGNYRLSNFTPTADAGNFLLRQNATDGELWRTDGTAAGTRKLLDFSGYAINEADEALPTIPGWLAITVQDTIRGRYLLLYNFINDESHILEAPSAGDGWPTVAAAKNNRFYLLLTDDYNGRELHYLDFGYAPSAPGYVFADDNANGLRDAGERGIPNYTVSVKEQGVRYTTYTDGAGAYTFPFREQGSYEISVETTACWQTEASNDSIVLTSVGAVATAPDFPVSPDMDFEMIKATLASATVRCGFTVPFWAIITNNGCAPLTDVTVSLDLDSEATVDSVEIAPSAIMDNTLSWDGIDLPVGASWRVYLEVVQPDEFRAGDIIPYTLDASGAYFEALRTADTFAYTPILRCAIDPNDKLVHPTRPEETNSNYTQIDETLTYTLRFQNTGNDTAFNVRLEDQLSQDLNMESFKPVGASHAYRVELSEAGLLEVFFDNIMLPDSNVNQLASNGFFAFTIGLDSSALDREVANTVGIYFDFNAPVITNTIVSNVVEFLDEDEDGFYFWTECDDQNPAVNPNAPDIGGNGIDEDCDGRDWTTATQDPLPGVLSLYPNPTKGLLSLEYSLPGELQIEVFDGRGRRMQGKLFKSSAQLDLLDLPAAMYLLKFTDPVSGRSASRRIVKF